MALFTARGRPRAARLSSTLSVSRLKSKVWRMYLYLYILGVVLVLVISVLLLQWRLTGTPPDPVHDPRHMRKGAIEDLRVRYRHKGESIRHENYKKDENLRRRRRSPVMSSGNRSKDWKVERKKGAEEESKSEEVHDYVDDVEEQGENSHMYQGQQLDDMDKFDREEAKEENVFKLQGQALDDMDKFDREEAKEENMFKPQGQALDDMDKFDREEAKEENVFKPQGQALDDMDKFDREEAKEENVFKLQGQALDDMDKFDREEAKEENVFKPQGQALDDMDKFDREEAKEENVFKPQGQALDDMDKFDNANRHIFVGESMPKFVEDANRSRKLQPNRDGKLGKNGRNGAESEKIDDPLVSEDKIPIRQAPEAEKGSVKAAIEQEMEKRNGRDSLRRSLGETTAKEGSSGMAPLRGFKDFLDDGKSSLLDTDDKPVDTNVKGEDAGDARMQVKLPLRDDVQTTVEDVVVHSLHVEENNKADGEQSPQTNVMKLTTMNSTLSEGSKAQEHLESVHDVVQTEKQVIKEEPLKNDEGRRNEGEKNVENEKNLEGEKKLKADEEGSALEGNENEEQMELRKSGKTDRAVKVKGVRGGKVAKKSNAKDEEKDQDQDNSIQWGFYPTLSSKLKFSKFLSSFFKQENCSLRIFMAWTTAPWAYTPRHQRAIESILHFHPQACIVVFTETIDFEFFHSWVKEGYKIAVARPNLEELLGKTPAIDFAYVWYEWRNMNLFYIHYTELLRIAALHKYGGVWLDMDMILARPLPKLHNVLGSTVSEDGEWVLNGAFMSFDKSSSFLKACIEEFVATYDETSLGWNGADLLNRVASNATLKGGKVWLEHSEHLQVLEPVAFFPLSRHKILKYFSAPTTIGERVEQKKMLSAILDESHGTHLWNSVTGRHVPEVGSLVEKLLNRFCMRCTDIL